MVIVAVLLAFLAGVAAGAVGLFLWQVWYWGRHD